MEVGVVLFVCVGVFLLPILWVVMMYNGLVRGRNTCDESWSDIDTELRRRYDLIPNLVKTVEGYASHERDVLERVAKARSAAMGSAGSPESQARDENALVASLRGLFVLSEGYPDLKASRHFLSLQEELAHTEDRIQRARRFYNGNVRDLNNRIEVFPSNIVASLFHFRRKEYFEIDDMEVRRPPEVRIDPS